MESPQTGDIQLTSPAFNEGEAIPAQYTCSGQNISPPLNIIDPPSNAKSLALIMHDPDAVSGDFVHWLMWDMPTGTKSIAANSVPVGAIQGINGAGNNQYMGPCPPAGTGVHHYKFEIYALDTTLGLDQSSDRNKLQEAMKVHVVAEYTLTGIVTAQ